MPAAAFLAAGPAAGDSLRGRVLGCGRILFERLGDQVALTAGIFDGICPDRAVDGRRDEWGRPAPLTRELEFEVRAA